MCVWDLASGKLEYSKEVCYGLRDGSNHKLNSLAVGTYNGTAYAAVAEAMEDGTRTGRLYYFICGIDTPWRVLRNNLASDDDVSIAFDRKGFLLFTVSESGQNSCVLQKWECLPTPALHKSIISSCDLQVHASAIAFDLQNNMVVLDCNLNTVHVFAVGESSSVLLRQVKLPWRPYPAVAVDHMDRVLASDMDCNGSIRCITLPPSFLSPLPLEAKLDAKSQPLAAAASAPQELQEQEMLQQLSLPD
jgi:hypothetical protein